MADNKQYITQVQDHGTVMISEDVIASIAAAAVTEVEGVCGLPQVLHRQPDVSLVPLGAEKIFRH